MITSLRQGYGGQARVVRVVVAVGEQEKKIRTVPTARVNDLLKQMFNR